MNNSLEGARPGTARFPPVLSFPVLTGMTYPRLESENLLSIAADPAAILAMRPEQRNEVLVLMTSATRGCSAELAKALPNLRLVVSQGAGQDRIDVAALRGQGVRVRSVGEALTEDVADLAMALVQATTRNILQADAFVRSGRWSDGRFSLGHSLVGATIGIAGLSGRIGQAIARRAVASCMNVVGLQRPSNAGLGVPLYADMRALAEASDILVLALPGGPELRGCVGAGELAALGKTGRLVNVGRGELVDTESLIDALERGVILGAGLDVIAGEPEVPPRLAKLPNVVLTPHIGGATWGHRERAAKIAEQEVLAALAVAVS
jgi:lactate dehydrogenase-like 2-hydroxyacid dehydrogenase